MELFFAAGVVADDLAVAEEFVFIGDEAFQTNGAAGVDLAG